MNHLDDHIKSALNKNVDFRLSENFSDRIIQIIVERAKRERRWELTGIIVAGLLFLAALLVTLSYTDFKFNLGAFTFLTDHFGLIAFGILFILALHIIDKKVIRKHQVS